MESIYRAAAEKIVETASGLMDTAKLPLDLTVAVDVQGEEITVTCKADHIAQFTSGIEVYRFKMKLAKKESSKAQLQEATIKAHCKSLRMPTVATQFGTMAEQAIREKKSHIGYLEALLFAEIEERERNTIERRIKEAHLPRVKTLEEFDYAQSPNVTAAKMRDLAEGGYIERAEPVLFIGECGTGKTHLLTGLCVAACRQKRRVRFTTAAGLVNELVEAKHQLQLRRVMARWSRYDLIAIDEVGYVPLAEVGAEFLFQVVAERAEKAAVVLTTNRLCGAPHKRFNAKSTFMRSGGRR
jgi:DNA replication protein DnaC